MPTETGDGRLGETWKTRVHAPFDRKKETQWTMYDGVCLARREALREEAFTLSKPALMWRDEVEARSRGLCRILTSWVRERQASKELKPGRELHWLGWSSS